MISCFREAHRGPAKTCSTHDRRKHFVGYASSSWVYIGCCVLQTRRGCVEQLVYRQCRKRTVEVKPPCSTLRFVVGVSKFTTHLRNYLSNSAARVYPITVLYFAGIPGYFNITFPTQFFAARSGSSVLDICSRKSVYCIEANWDLSVDRLVQPEMWLLQVSSYLAQQKNSYRIGKIMRSTWILRLTPVRPSGARANTNESGMGLHPYRLSCGGRVAHESCPEPIDMSNDVFSGVNSDRFQQYFTSTIFFRLTPPCSRAVQIKADDAD